MVTKQEFFAYMSALYDEDYDDTEAYKTFKSIVKLKDEKKIKELKAIVNMTKAQRLLYRHSLAANGKELTPTQLDQYISTIDYALSNIDT